MPKETIGPKIKAFRKGRGLTQAELADALGYSHKSVITHIEKGDSEMSYDKILLLLRTFAIDANELFDVKQIDRLIEERERAKKEEARRNAWMKDILFDIDGELFSYRIGGALIKDNRVLLTKGGDDYSLPGGHAQIGETSKQTIVREFKEETALDVEPVNVLSTFENFYEWDGKKCHQLCVYYWLRLLDAEQELMPNPDVKGIEYVWVNIDELKSIDLYPIGLSDQIREGLIDKAHVIYVE